MLLEHEAVDEQTLTTTALSSDGEDALASAPLPGVACGKELSRDMRVRGVHTLSTAGAQYRQMEEVRVQPGRPVSELRGSSDVGDWKIPGTRV